MAPLLLEHKGFEDLRGREFGLGQNFTCVDDNAWKRIKKRKYKNFSCHIYVSRIISDDDDINNEDCRGGGDDGGGDVGDDGGGDDGDDGGGGGGGNEKALMYGHENSVS